MTVSDRRSAQASHAHLLAHFADVPSDTLHDASRLAGLLIAAASAAGLHALGAPVVRTSRVQGIDAMLLLEGGHAALHTNPAAASLLVDLVAPVSINLVLALDVMSRRLAPATVHAERLLRG